MVSRIVMMMVSLAAAFAGPLQTVEMTGPATRSQILAASPEWEAVMAAYQPHPEAVETLRRIGQPVLIEAYFGSWCSDSKAHVPALFKILEMADNPLLQVSFAAIPRDKAARARFIPEGRDVDKLPTFLVFLNSREIGRIIETPARSMEEDLAALLRR